MMFKTKLSILICVMVVIVNAQESGNSKVKGKLSGQWRTYYMNTVNDGSLKDFVALASGGKIKYQFELSNMFEVGAALYNTTNFGLQDLTIPDQTTGRLSRYEEGLYDRLDLENDAIFLLGELYLTYKSKQHEITLGRFKVNTPLINPQDGRMLPTLVQGLWYRNRISKESYVEIGALNRIAPRSTGRFYEIGESIGTYPEGRDSSGGPSQFVGNTISDYVIIANGIAKVADGVTVSFSNFYVDNVSNSFYLKPTVHVTPKVNWELEWLHQNRIGDGGNEVDALRYFTSKTSDILGTRIGYKFDKSGVSLAYNRILNQGQFSSPREWGREDLFSFQKRERSEGSGDNHALVFYFHNSLSLVKDEADLKSIFSIGRHWKPSVLNPVLNKYAMTDYTHINLDLFFDIKSLKGFKPELLLVGKIANGDFPENPNFIFNKANLFHVDLILNYNF